MSERPRAPIGVAVVWLAVATDVSASLVLWTSSEEVWVKAVASGLLIVGHIAIVAFYAGRIWQWWTARQNEAHWLEQFREDARPTEERPAVPKGQPAPPEHRAGKHSTWV